MDVKLVGFYNLSKASASFVSCAQRGRRRWRNKISWLRRVPNLPLEVSPVFEEILYEEVPLFLQTVIKLELTTCNNQKKPGIPKCSNFFYSCRRRSEFFCRSREMRADRCPLKTANKLIGMHSRLAYFRNMQS